MIDGILIALGVFFGLATIDTIVRLVGKFIREENARRGSEEEI